MTLAAPEKLESRSPAPPEASLRARYEPDWLTGVRRDARSRFEAAPMPVHADERWRRTDVSRLDLGRLDGAPSLAKLEMSAGLEAGSILRVNGFLDGPGQHAFFGSMPDLPPGVGALVRERMTAPAPDDVDKFEWLARAEGTGYAVHVPRGVEVEEPLRAFFQVGDDSSTEESLRNSCVYPRSIVIAEPGSRVTIIEEFRGRSGVGPWLSSGLTEVFVGEGAEVTIVSLQDWSDETWNFHTQRSHVAADGRIVTLSIHLGSRVTKANIEGVLVGDRAESRMLGIVSGTGKRHLDLYTLQDHAANDTRSNLLFKSALRDEAKSIYSGLIRVGKSVTGADAYQANRNLLLSGKAKADSQPMLEILNNEVRCTHGATVGPIDPEQLFYLQSRGISLPEAERVVTEGFFEETLDPVANEAVREWARARVIGRRE